MNEDNMQAKKKYPPNLVLTSVLSGGLTIGLALIYILLTIAFLLLRGSCGMGDLSQAGGADFFWLTIFRVYVLSGDICDLTHPTAALTIQRLTSDHALLVLVSLTLSISVLCVAAAVTLVSIIQDERQSRYLVYAVCAYIGCCVLSLIIDVITASHFAADYSYMTSLLRQLTAGSPSSYRTEVIRQGAFWLMTITLKGYVALVINCIFLVLLAVYIYDFQKTLKSNEHSIHKLGALTAFDQQRKTEDDWSQGEMYNSPPFLRGPNTNSAFVDDLTPPRSRMNQEPTRNDYNNRAFDRSDSWHHNRHNSERNSRPFSYLEDIKRPMPTKLQPPAPVEPQWRRDPSPVLESPWRREPSPTVESSWRHERDPWPQEPSVPAPDYSPTVPRRLKSALKPAY